MTAHETGPWWKDAVRRWLDPPAELPAHEVVVLQPYGSLFFAAAIFPEDRVTIRGETHAYRGRHFCPVCGSSVFSRYADEVEVHLGALDQVDRFVPTYES